MYVYSYMYVEKYILWLLNDILFFLSLINISLRNLFMIKINFDIIYIYGILILY